MTSEGSDNAIEAVTKRNTSRNTESSLSASEKTPTATAADVEARDVRTKQVFSRKLLLWLSYQSIGVIYGDIGTSPLYVYSSTFSSEPSNQDLLGALSLIIWTLTLIVSVKYALIVLRADDEGEGGTFAVYTLLSRHANIVQRDPREEHLVKSERVASADMKSPNRAIRMLLEKSAVVKSLLKIVGVFGVTLVISDGVLTPAQSVLGAVQGLEVVVPDITKSAIVGTSCGILVVLFILQPLGTTKLGTTFAPVVIVWLLFNMTFGIYNLAKFDHTMLKALNPYYAGAYLQRNKVEGWRSLGGILLSFTGSEALFADLGAFSAAAIRLSWLCFAYPCLLLAYIGQAAHISQNPGSFSNPFFNAVPPGMFYPSLVVAILAAVVASQTLITATFQLLSQIMKLSYFPQVRVFHTSKVFHHQIYIPWANWLLLIGTVCVTVAYSDTTKLGQAYGVCVILVTFLTTCMVSLVALVIWNLNALLVLFGFLVFAALDGLYLSSALAKVPEGAWFALALAIVLMSVFVLWRYGKENQWRAEAEDRHPPWRILSIDEGSSNVTPHLSKAMGGGPISKLRGVGVFFDKTGQPNATPSVFIHFLQKFQAMPSIVVFFHMRALSIPTVNAADRYTVSRCWTAPQDQSGSLDNVYRVTVRYGYTDEAISKDLNATLLSALKEFIMQEQQTNDSSAVRKAQEGAVDGATERAAVSSGFRVRFKGIPESIEERSITEAARTHEELVRSRLTEIQDAYQEQVVHIVGKEQMRISGTERKCGLVVGRSWLRSVLLSCFLWLRSNTGSKVANMNLDIEKLVEVGFVKMV